MLTSRQVESRQRPVRKRPSFFRGNEERPGHEKRSTAEFSPLLEGDDGENASDRAPRRAAPPGGAFVEVAAEITSGFSE